VTALAAPPERRVYGPISTQGFHSLLTWKQSDVLVILDSPEQDPVWDNNTWPRLTTAEVEKSLRDFLDCMGMDLSYTSPSAYSTLRALESRGLVGRYADGRWALTNTGRKWAMENL